MPDFRIDILNASGAVLAPGPVITAVTLDDTRRLDEIGSLTFTMPATDPRAAYINAGVSFRVYDRVDGFIGQFYYRTKKLQTDANNRAELRVDAHDQLIELARQSVRFRRNYVFQDVADVVEDLVGDVSGWSAEADASIGDTTVSYEGESVLGAVDVLRDRWNQHFRLNRESVLGFGAFGDDAGLVVTNLSGQVQAEIEQNSNLALVDRMELVDEADEIFNRVIPLGAGQGTAQLTIELATLGAYTVQTGTNEDGSSYFYIENSASVSAYGRRDRVLLFPQIRPITNSDANIENAANALKLTAEAYIARHLIPRVTYRTSVRKLPPTVNVGDLIQLQFRGLVDKYAYVDVDELFYVMDIMRKRNAVSGERSAEIVISSLAERRTSDTDIVLEVIRDVRALKVNVPIVPTKDRVGPYVQRIDSTHTAEFTVFFGNEVLALNYAKLRFRTSPLKSSVTSTSTADTDETTSGASSASSSAAGSAHSHSITIAGTDVASTANGGSSTPTSNAEGTTHGHNITVTNTSGGTALNVVDGGGGSVLARANGIGGNLDTEVNSVTHTHDVTIAAHSHTISHGHTGSTGANESSHTHNIAHTHSVEISGHGHTLDYGIHEDTDYPQTISLAINGDDVTVALGGTWAPSNASVEVEVDITAYLVDASGGLRQNHRVEFSCVSGQGEIEMECNILETIQPIVVS